MIKQVPTKPAQVSLLIAINCPITDIIIRIQSLLIAIMKIFHVITTSKFSRSISPCSAMKINHWRLSFIIMLQHLINFSCSLDCLIQLISKFTFNYNFLYLLLNVSLPPENTWWKNRHTDNRWSMYQLAQGLIGHEKVLFSLKYLPFCCEWNVIK